ncbi:MAG: sodium:proton antiporter [Leptolyngbya sp. SIO4C5]|uniref:cation:proton antiporter n=1 Tax=Sphaerothrix gracilis TaxID=3151835 RepID=UPI0013BF6198|nr:sodium:proton antiporter [Leptolyngbya sp. SIO4C5]
MTYISLLLILGLLLLVVTLGSGWIARLPFSYAILYLVVGIALGPQGTGWIALRPDAELIERLTEFVVIVSVFGCGLKMNRPLKPWAWQSTARLIGFLMPLSIVAIAFASHWLLKLDWGAAILLGACLAPTDPVLASEVQMENPDDGDELRFGLTSEGGLNDSLAFPFVYFGIYWLTKGNWQDWFTQWVAVDLIWAIAAGIGMGIGVAKAIAWIDGKLQQQRPADDLMEDLLALSAILLTYSLTELVNGYGFLAVFVAGITIRRNAHCDPGKRLAQLEFTEQIEKLLEVATILLLGSLLQFSSLVRYGYDGLIITAVLLFFVRPIGAWLSFLGCRLPKATRRLVGWFGIRGIGSIYYLTYALGHDIGSAVSERLSWIIYIVVTVSIVLHGISATPLMQWYKNRRPGQAVSESS